MNMCKYFPVRCIRTITGQSCYAPHTAGACRVWDGEAHQNNVGFGTGRNLRLEGACGALEADSGAGPGQGAPSRSVPVWRFAAQCDVQGREPGAAGSPATPSSAGNRAAALPGAPGAWEGWWCLRWLRDEPCSCPLLEDVTGLWRQAT